MNLETQPLSEMWGGDFHHFNESPALAPLRPIVFLETEYLEQDKFNGIENCNGYNFAPEKRFDNFSSKLNTELNLFFKKHFQIVLGKINALENEEERKLFKFYLKECIAIIGKYRNLPVPTHIKQIFKDNLSLILFKFPSFWLHDDAGKVLSRNDIEELSTTTKFIHFHNLYENCKEFKNDLPKEVFKTLQKGLGEACTLYGFLEYAKRRPINSKHPKHSLRTPSKCFRCASCLKLFQPFEHKSFHFHKCNLPNSPYESIQKIIVPHKNFTCDGIKTPSLELFNENTKQTLLHSISKREYIVVELEALIATSKDESEIKEAKRCRNIIAKQVEDLNKALFYYSSEL